MAKIEQEKDGEGRTCLEGLTQQTRGFNNEPKGLYNII
jgi:hypothetical protein